ncbi:MAG: zf-TFIIB domain-containing protein [Limisphaerales bacterium]
MKPNLIELQIQFHRRNTEHRAVTPRKCPVCAGTELVAIDRQGIEIDCCPKCRGVWLDRGELERLIDYGGRGSVEIRIQRAPIPGDTNGEQTEPALQRHSFPGQPGRKRSWLREIFD